MQVSTCLLVLSSLILVPAAIGATYGIYCLFQRSVKMIGKPFIFIPNWTHGAATASVCLLVGYFAIINISVEPCSEKEKAVAKKMTEIVPVISTISPCGCEE